MFGGNLTRRTLFYARNWGVTQIHAGLHKTGSTSLQRSLRAAGLLQSAVRSDFRDAEALRRVLLEADSRQRVVSSEHLLGEMYDMYSTAVERARLIQRVVDRSRLTVYVRPHWQWHAAAYSQIIQQGTILTRGDYEAHVEAQRYFSLKQLCSDLLSLRSSSAEVQIRVSKDVVADYSSVIGVPLARPKWLNQSLSPMALEALIRLRDDCSIPTREVRHALRSFMPESRFTSSVFSRQFQLRLIDMRADWIDFSKALASSGQPISNDWGRAYERQLLPPASEIFTAGDLDAARTHVRLAGNK